MRIIPIVFAFDNNMLFPAKICIESLLINAKKETFYDIFILYGTGTEFEKNDFEKIKRHYNNCNFHFRSIGSKFNNCFEIRGITYAAYYRLMIPWIIREYDKIIYSDVDVIFREDLTEIYDSVGNMNQFYLAGVKSIAVYNNKEAQKELLNKYDLDNKDFIYSGNLIFNSKQMRADDLDLEFNKHIEKKYSAQDQAILNIVCKNKILFLPPKFCLTNYMYETIIYNKKLAITVYSEEQINEASKSGLIHYNGPKPWKEICINFDIWWEYYRKSIFFDKEVYFKFFANKMDEFEMMSLAERLKKVYRYFRYGKKSKR